MREQLDQKGIVSVVYLFCLVERHEHERNGAKFGIIPAVIASFYLFWLLYLSVMSMRKADPGIYCYSLLIIIIFNL